MADFKVLKRKDSTELKPIWGKLKTVLLFPEVTDQPQLWPADTTMQRIGDKSSFFPFVRKLGVGPSVS